MWYQRERNKQISVYNEGFKHLSVSFGVFMKEVDKLQQLFNEWQASEMEKQQRQKDERQKRAAVVIIQKYVRKCIVKRAYLKLLSSATFIQNCWRQVLARKEFQRLKQEAKEVSIVLIKDSRTNLFEERGNDTIQEEVEQANSDFGAKSSTVQFCANEHISQSEYRIKLEFYEESPDILFYLGLKFQVIRSSGRLSNTGQNRLYEFCYLFHFDLWTSYLARIMFLQGSGRLFWEFPSFTRIFNGLVQRVWAKSSLGEIEILQDQPIVQSNSSARRPQSMSKWA